MLSELVPKDYTRKTVHGKSKQYFQLSPLIVKTSRFSSETFGMRRSRSLYTIVPARNR